MKAHVRRLLRQRLSTQVVIMMVAILVVTMAAGFVVVQWNLNRQLDEQSPADRRCRPGRWRR
jgi:cell division protein FtsX